MVNKGRKAPPDPTRAHSGPFLEKVDPFPHPINRETQKFKFHYKHFYYELSSKFPIPPNEYKNNKFSRENSCNVQSLIQKMVKLANLRTSPLGGFSKSPKTKSQKIHIFRAHCFMKESLQKKGFCKKISKKLAMKFDTNRKKQV